MDQQKFSSHAKNLKEQLSDEWPDSAFLQGLLSVTEGNRGGKGRREKKEVGVSG